MRKIIATAALAACTLFLTSSLVTAAEETKKAESPKTDAAPAPATGKMRGDELKALLAGKSVTGTLEEGGAFEATYNADGSYTATMKEKPEKGTWQATGVGLCRKAESDKEETCFTILKKGERYFSYKKRDNAKGAVQAEMWTIKGAGAPAAPAAEKKGKN